MSRLSLNILANLAGQGWSVVISVVVIPFYIKFLGIEAYGLLGFYITLQGVLQVLDLGLSPTMNRELARYSAMPDKAGEARDFVRTLEVGYWAIGIAIGALALTTAPLIARYWVKASAIPLSDVEQAVMLMGVLVALQWPLSFYGSGLMGLQKQVLLNSCLIPLTTLSSGGAVLILWLVSPTITAFFSWQVGVSAIQVSLITFLLWRSLPQSSHPTKINLGLIRDIWHFAAGMSGIAISAIILTHLDKVILSKMLSLEKFGYYTLAGVIGRGLYVLITPMFNAIFPRFSELVAAENGKGLKEVYHRGAQLMAVLVLPFAAVVGMFSYEILLLWIGNVEAARNAAPIASVLVIGTALNGLLNLPYALQLAYGWTRFSLYINISFIFTLVPAIIIMTSHYGAIGGAAVWVVLNVLYMLIGVPLTHNRFLKGEAWQWFGVDVCLPFAATLMVVGVGRWSIDGAMSPMIALTNLTMILLGGILAAVMSAPDLRARVLIQLSKDKSFHS